MTTVRYVLSASVKSLTASPSLPAGYAPLTIAEADLQAFCDNLDKVEETVTGDTLTDRMRKLRTKLATLLAGLSDYSGPTDVHANNSDVPTDGTWVPSYDVSVHPRGADVNGDPSVCVAQDASQTWLVALVHAAEVTP